VGSCSLSPESAGEIEFVYVEDTSRSAGIGEGIATGNATFESEAPS
jgi:hypothetical protein